MGKVLKYGVLLITVALTGCFEKDVFPDTPSIAFENIVFYDGNFADSLVLTFSFEDGNGDIGLNPTLDILPPFHEYNVFLDSRDSVITEDNVNDAVPPVYTAPLITQNFILIGVSGNTLIVDQSESDYPILAFGKEHYSDDAADIPFECPGLANQDGNLFNTTTLTPYIFGETGGSLVPSSSGTQAIISTIPVQRVETHYNFIIEFQKKVGSDYVPLNFRQIFQTTQCDIGIFNGRIPLFDPEGKSGTYTYSMQSSGFIGAFKDDIVRAKFYVYDRAGNKSNEAFTSDFILADITQ